MLWEEIKHIKSDGKELKKFGITIGIFLLLLGGFFYYLDKEYYCYFLFVGVLIAVLGFAAPKLLLPLQKGWMALAVVLGFIMTRVILSLLYFLVFTPMSIIAKLVGKSFLDMKIDKSASSYWYYREKKEYRRVDTERQF